MCAQADFIHQSSQLIPSVCSLHAKLTVYWILAHWYDHTIDANWVTVSVLFVLLSGRHPAKGGPRALGRRICHRVRHHGPRKLRGCGAATKSPRGGEEAEKRASGPRGQQVRPGPRPAGWHGGRRAAGGWNGVRLLRMFGVRQRGRRRGRGLPRAVPRSEAPQGRAGQGQTPQLHHARQTGHKQDADQDQQLEKKSLTEQEMYNFLM